MALVLPEHRSDAVSRWIEELPDEAEIVVPTLWWYETTNVLLTAVRRKLISAAEAREAMAAVRGIPQKTHEPPGPVAAMHFFHLGTRFAITAYDAAYLALAELTAGTLVTLDRTLADAAAAMQIPVVTPG